MKLSAYIVRFDGGFAPHPFGRVCTLACCKPVIRRHAEAGDIIVGTGSASSGLEGHLIYAMRVTEVLPYDEYWQRYPSRRPSPRTAISGLGDNIWHRDSQGRWQGVPGAVHGLDQLEHDVSGENVLISSDFYYFGRSAIRLPAALQGLLAITQGHKNTHDRELITRFWKWLQRTAPRRGRLDVPLLFDAEGCVPGEGRKTGCERRGC